MGAALAVTGRKRTAIALAASAIAFFACGTRTFARFAGSDPLLTDREPLWVKSPMPLATRSLDRRANKLRMSADAQKIAVHWLQPGDEEDDVVGTFGVGMIAGPLEDIKAVDIAFASNGLLQLQETESGVELSDGTDWIVRLPVIISPRLTAVGRDGWRISGTRPRNYKPIRYMGRIGSNSYSTGWLPQAGLPIASAEGSNDVLYASLDIPPLARRIPWIVMVLPSIGSTELWRSSLTSEKRIGRTVVGAREIFWLPDSDQWVVIGRDATSTYVATVDKSIHAAGSIRGNALAAGTGSGSRIALIDSNRDVIVWNLRSGKAMRIGCAECSAHDVAFADHAVGVLRLRGMRTEVVVFPTD